MPENNSPCIFIIISRTSTFLGRVIQKRFNVKYNHCSLAFDDSLEEFYSFGRKRPRNFISGGFVCESKNSGFFKCFGNSKILVLRVPVTPDQLAKAHAHVDHFVENRHAYGFSRLGLLFCAVGIPIKRNRKYFCSQFVAEILLQSDIYDFGKSEALVRPHDFLALLEPDRVVYKGKIANYPSPSVFTSLVESPSA